MYYSNSTPGLYAKTIKVTTAFIKALILSYLNYCDEKYTTWVHMYFCILKELIYVNQQHVRISLVCV